MSELRFGLFLPQMRMPYSTILSRVHTAERVGFDSVWFMDHLAPPALAEADCLEAWTVATAVAASTTRIRIGHLVLCDAFRHPSLLAKMASTLDVLSEGRLDLGIGSGSVPGELDRFGFGAGSPARRAGRLGESLQIMRLLWTGEAVDFAGEHFTLHSAMQRPVPVQGSIPIHVGGAGARMLALARAHADWWNCPTTATDRLGELVAATPGLRRSVQHVVGLAASPAERDQVVQTARRRFGAWGAGVVAGTAEEVAAVVSAEARQGADGFVVAFSDFGDVGTLARFMHEVVPAVREGAGDRANVRP